MARQRVLHEGDHRFAFLIEESVLYSGVGGAEVMVGQLGHLRTVGSLPNVSFSVLPMGPDRSRFLDLRRRPGQRRAGVRLPDDFPAT